MVNLSEKETREQYIDKELYEQGWKENYIKKEINSVKSNFKKRQYIPFDGNIERGVDRFVDYILTDDKENPIAIIEAKRFSLDPEKGSIQATTYQNDIESQIGYSIPIFLTNGRKWYLKEIGYPMRGVAGVFSQKDLKKRLDLSKSKRDLSNVEINKEIVDRSKSIQIVKQVLDHFATGKRNALINMATGTGKTRVSMALIDALVKSRYIQNVLFVVDRISLSKQAYDNGFRKFFEATPSCQINEQGFEDTKRFYVSTVQTLMTKQKLGGFKFQKFSPGFFDLIIFDEAHRSYYDKNNQIVKYFDSYKIGLTATPSKTEDKNTYELFECERGIPTVEYNYDEAVKDGVLVPYDAQMIKTSVMELGIKGIELDKELKTDLIKQNYDPDSFEVPGTKYARYFTDKKTNELIVQEFMARCHKTEEGKPCKTIFFCVNRQHARELAKVLGDIYTNLADDVKVITSEKDRYMDEVKRFKDDSSPRIAFSVGVLDTGIDIPEICNLVFVVPVFSHIRFWQMVGRGTRNKGAVRSSHIKYLPKYEEIHDKQDFRILDFMFGDFSNIKEHQLESSDNKKSGEDIRVKIFKKEVDLLKNRLNNEEKEVIEKDILEKVSKIDQKSFIVKEKVPMIKKFIAREYNLEEHIKELKEEIAPLMQFSEYGNGKVQSFISKCIDLMKFVKESDIEGITKIREFIEERVMNVWESNLESVRNKSEEIKKVMQEKFWEELTFEEIDFMIRVIAPLMIFYEKEKGRRIIIHAPDFIREVESLKMEPKNSKELEEFKKLPLIQKMKEQGVTWKELLEISRQLAKLNSSWEIGNVQKTQDFVMFLRHNILGLQDLPDPEEMIKTEFEKLIIAENKQYNADQISFLRLLGSFFAQNKHLEKKDLVSHPLSEENPLSKFSPDQLEYVIKQAEKIKMR